MALPAIQSGVEYSPPSLNKQGFVQRHDNETTYDSFRDDRRVSTGPVHSIFNHFRFQAGRDHIQTSLGDVTEES